MSDADDNRERRIATRTKLAFSAGSIEDSIIGAASLTTIIFYNQVLGLSAALCGMAMLIASVADAITDPLVGNLSDRWRSRWGRRHPPMLASAVPMAITFYLMYQPIAGLSEVGLFLWLTLTSVMLRTFKTIFVIPHNALGAELTDNYEERTSVFAYNGVALMASNHVLALVVLFLVFPSSPDYSNGLLDPNRYDLLAWLGAVGILVAVFYCVWGTRDQIPYLHAHDRSRLALRDHVSNMGQLFRNRSYRAVCVTWLIMATSGGILGTVSTYCYVYAFQISTEEIGVVRFGLIPGLFIALPLASYCTRQLDKKWTMLFAVMGAAFFAGFPYTMALLGWAPSSESGMLLPFLVGSMVMMGLTYPLVPIVVDSMLSDVADEHELETGQRSEGLIFSIKSFCMKTTHGLGGLIAGFGLEIIDFPERAEVGDLAPGTLDGLLLMAGPGYYLFVLIGLSFGLTYAISRTRHRQILATLAERRRIRGKRSHGAGSGAGRGYFGDAVEAE